MNQISPIAAAVAPLKSEALARAERDAREHFTQLLGKLAAAGWDLQAVAPYPNSLRDSRKTYLAKQRLRNVYETITKRDPSVQHDYRMDKPCIVVINEPGIERLVERVIEDAGVAYDAFVAKLEEKVGACDAAELAGSHVWGWSILTVTKGETVERWKTQQIVNVSSLGLLFNQWPTRKVK